VDRQSLLLFEKVLGYIFDKDPNYRPENKESKHKYICSGKDRPTKHELKLRNGSIIRCLPTGDDGYGIRGYTIDRLYADEAAFISEEVWASVTPMLATTGGSIILLSTPLGKENYFFRMSENKKFEFIHVDPDEVIAGRPEPQRTNLIEFRKDEKERMTKLQYQQEHLGLFVGGIERFFTKELIDAICTGKQHVPIGDKYQGIDIARMGGDETVLVSGDRINRERLIQFDLTIPEPQTLPDTTRLILKKDLLINHKKIYIDDGGMGVGVSDPLSENRQTRNKIITTNNASRSIDSIKKPRRIGLKRTITHTEVKKIPLLGEVMAINFRNLAENGKIQLLDDTRIRHSLRTMQCDYSDGKLKIYGNYDHIFEALKRLAYCLKDKSLKPFIYYG
ncbi:hypothetical protein LCGC14_1244190, partial [marine sediment metagenome]